METIHLLLVFLSLCSANRNKSEPAWCLASENGLNIGINCLFDETLIEIKDKTSLLPYGTKCPTSYAGDNGEWFYWFCQDGKWIPIKEEDERDINIGTTTVQGLQRREKRFLFLLFCLFTLCPLWYRPDPPRDNTTPRFVMPLPSDMILVAEPIQVYARATWQEPKAVDDNCPNGQCAVFREGSPPDRDLMEGPHKIIYRARDRAGNEALWSFTVIVTVIRCSNPTPINNGYYICHPSTDFVLGTFCSFGCYDGFELKGPQSIVCKDTKKWSDSQPQCVPFKCPILPEIEGTTLQCSNGRYFRSICSYNCQKGFDMPPGVSSTVICSISKIWKKTGDPRCMDIEPPTFEFCPDVVIAGTDRGSNFGQASWRDPKIKDNSNKTIEPKILRGQKPDSLFTVGTHEIEYSAFDIDGNKAIPCKFKVVIKDVRCPRLFPTPFMQINCPDGHRSGSVCNFTCEAGKTLEGQSFILCEKSNQGLYGSWQWRNQKPSCKVGRKCLPITPPENGAVACDIWMGGQFCQVQCSQGTDMPPNFDWRKLQVCGKDSRTGESLWVPPVKITKCQTSRHGSPSINAMSYFYVGDCPEETTKQQIKDNFYQAIKTSLYAELICIDHSECNNQTVEVNCGAVDRHRRKRETDVINITDHTILTLSYKVSSITMIGANFTQVHSLFGRFMNHLETMMASENYTDGFKHLKMKYSRTENSRILLTCPQGSVEANGSFSCVLCPEGTYYDNRAKHCMPCLKGTYQDEPGQSSCKFCPNRTTTRADQSSSIHQCEAACDPGTWSSDGVEPCSACETGLYQPNYGQTSCMRCNGARTTLLPGSSTKLDCQEFDIEFPDIINKSVSLMLLSTKRMTNFSISLWIRVHRLGNTSILRLIGEDKTDICSISNTNTIAINYLGLTFATTKRLDDVRWHQLTLIRTLCRIRLRFDQNFVLDEDVPCGGEVSLQDIIVGGNTFTGSISQVNVFRTTDLAELPNGTTCFQHNGGDIVNWNEFEYVNLEGAFIHIPSQCDDLDECLNGPCKHGNCSDGLRSYTCSCEVGYTGSQCDLNINDCTVNVCMNGAKCLDGVASYTCVCSANYTGQYCEIEMVDGQWGAWGNWSSCSTTCGEGIKTRHRLCNSPEPDNGGRYCVGSAVGYSPCNESACKVCPELNPPDNGTLQCFNTSRSINCTAHCKDGFDFDIAPYDYYSCGPDSFYEWNVQTDDNPLGRLPSCSEIRPSDHINLTFSAYYKDLECQDTEHSERTEKEVISKVLGVTNGLECLQSKSCELNGIEITNCMSSRGRRSVTQAKAGFSITLSTSPSIGNSGNKISALDRAMRIISDATNNGHFTVHLYGQDFFIDLGNAQFTGGVACAPGLIRVNYYCLPCGKGTYMTGHYCEFCDIGTYQDKHGQTSCIPCSKGLTTTGKGSKSIDSCHGSPALEIHGLSVIAIVLGTSAGVLVVLVVILVTYILKRAKRQKINIHIPYPLDLNINDQVANRKFRLKSLASDSSNSVKTVPKDITEM